MASYYCVKKFVSYRSRGRRRRGWRNGKQFSKSWTFSIFSYQCISKLVLHTYERDGVICLHQYLPFLRIFICGLEVLYWEAHAYYPRIMLTIRGASGLYFTTS